MRISSKNTRTNRRRKRLEDVVHQSLKCCRRIRQPEGHDKELEVAVMRPESRPMDVVRVHAHLMISAPQVELGEKAGAPKFIQEFVDDWDRKLVLDRLVIQGPEVNAESP